jgi:hypothetical protein
MEGECIMKKIIILFLFFSPFIPITVQASDFETPSHPHRILPSKRVAAEIKTISSSIAKGDSKEVILTKWRALLLGSNMQGTDINVLVQQVIRESYLAAAEDLKKYADKVKYYNEQKLKVTDAIEKARRTQMTPGSSLNKMNIIMEKGTSGQITMRNIGFVKTEQERQEYVRYLDSKLNQFNEDARIVSLEYENVSQRQQGINRQLSLLSGELKRTAILILQRKEK